MKSLLQKFAIVAALLGILAGGYYVLFVKQGLLAVDLKMPSGLNITPSEPAMESEQNTGEVLGGSADSKANPLKDIYVNPFAK